MALLQTIKKMMPRFRGRKPNILGNAWDAAGHGKRLKNWWPSSESVNSLLAASLGILRSRSRNAVRNNPVASNAIEAMVVNCIGTGIKPQSKAPDSDFKEELQELWLEWKDEADITGTCDFYGLQALICHSMMEGGECFVRLRVRPDKNLSVPLQLQTLESEHLNDTLNERASNGNIIKQGIEFTPDNERVAYHFYREHPGEQILFSNGESIRIPADEILHIYKPLRIGQIRGVPWLSKVLLKLYELEQYDDAELVRKKTAALFAAFITRLDPDGNLMGEGPEDEDGLALVELEPGTVQLLEPGEDIKFSAPSDVGSSYETFMRQQLRFIAIGMGITYEQLSGDLTGVNYSSIRAGMIEFRRRCEMLQRHTMVFQLCRPVWNKWLQMAVLSGRINLPDNSFKYRSVKWIPQGFEWVDPLKDQQADQMAMKNGVKSRSQVVSEYGFDAEEVDKEIAADNARADKLGLKYDSDPRYGKAAR